MTFPPPRFLAFALLCTALNVGTSARAVFILKIEEDNNPAEVVMLTGTPGTPLLYTSPGMGNPLPDFIVTGLSASSNSNAPAAFASLSLQGTISENAASTGAHSLTIQVTDTNFMFPAGPNYVLSSAASDSYTFGNTGDTHTFVSTGNGTNSSTLSLPLTNPLNGSNSGVSPVTPFSALTLPYTLSNLTVITLPMPGSFSQTGVNLLETTNAAIPEPSSTVMLGLGLLAVLGLTRQRCKTSRSA